jgi:hypothetical protein
MTGLDEFTFIGDSMDSLVAALNDNTNAIIGKTGEELSNKAA